MSNTKGNILIIEDEFIISDDLSSTLKECNYNVVGIAENYEEALPFLENKPIDLVLLDINLNADIDGVEIAHIINTKFNFPFIFVTAFTDQKTIARVKHTNPYGYVTKPYNDINLVMTIDIALSKAKSVKSNENSQQNELNQDSIFIKTKNGLEKITLTDIRWIEAYDYYAFIQLENKKVLATSTLKELEQKLNNPSFVKIHRKYCINMTHIDKIVGNQVEILGELIPISRSHKNDLLNKLTLI